MNAVAAFPPTSMLTQWAARAEDRTRKLERLYHAAQTQAWDGREVLDALLAKHGGIRLPLEKREAIARVFSIILWGELAAWNVSAELAERIVDPEAKLAATGQAFDEARHFTVMRDYLLALDIELPPLDPYSRAVLRDVLETESIVFKLTGMQLLVENAALSLFKMVARGGIEPVLTELVTYIEKDEARHVGLGVLYLPRLMATMTTYEAAKLQLFQARIYGLLFWNTILLRRDFELLGLDANDATRQGLRLQIDIATQMGKFDRGRSGGARGVYVEPELLRRTHDFSVDAFFPHPGDDVPPWHRRVLAVTERFAKVGARFLERVDP
ncbi:MAG: ferritin-like domain-containing protein [Deltaproteobacteria bacterium]|nr:ferritin-like domain-containing protein [Deltaproteobacteria bacterium]